jgi:hypothetical protein
MGKAKTGQESRRNAHFLADDVSVELARTAFSRCAAARFRFSATILDAGRTMCRHGANGPHDLYTVSGGPDWIGVPPRLQLASLRIYGPHHAQGRALWSGLGPNAGGALQYNERRCQNLAHPRSPRLRPNMCVMLRLGTAPFV